LQNYNLAFVNNLRENPQPIIPMKKLTHLNVLCACAQNQVQVTFIVTQDPNISMKNLISLPLRLCLFSLLILNSAFAQSLKQDTSLLHFAINNANSYYTRAIGQQLPLNNGPEYNFYNPLKFKGSAYFKDTSYVRGNVYYDGAEYYGVQLLYDLFKDQLTAILFDHYSKYTLLNDRVQNFDLLGHHFININTDTLRKSTVLKAGYYDELYHGLYLLQGKR